MESAKLNNTVNDFVVEMKKRLTEKEKEGYEGWDDNTQLHLLQRAKTKLKQGKYIDVANLVMMLWYRSKAKGVPQ